jgi:hypothetical protein
MFFLREPENTQFSVTDGERQPVGTRIFEIITRQETAG